MNTRELQEGSQKHESRAKGGTVARAMTKTTLEAKPGAEDSKNCAVDSIDNSRLGTETTDKELGFADNTVDFTDCTMDSTDCAKSTDDSADFTDPAVDPTDCTDCAELTDAQKRYVSNSKD